MSTHAGHQPPEPEFLDRKVLGPLPALFLGLAVLGGVGTVIGAMLDVKQFAFSWLFAFMFFFTLCVGSLFWTLVHHATDAEWSVVVRRQLENVAVLCGAMVVLFIPVVFCRTYLFQWMNIPEGVNHLLDLKRGYLNQPFFWARAVIYFTLLTGVAVLLRSFSRRQDEDGLPRHTIYMRRVAFAGIPALAISLTFSAFDWLMGLEYQWFSTMWGVYLFAGAAGSAMCLLVLVISGLRSKGYLKSVVSMEHYHIMGKLMLAFCIFWAYIGFSQYMLIWYANVPEETSYFIRRNIAGWNVLSTILVVGRFFLPFPLLLMQGFKKQTQVICTIAVWILAMQVLDIYIIVMPMLHQTGFAPHFLDLTSFLTIGGILGFLFLSIVPKSPLFPTRDPRLMESINLSN